MKRLVLLVTLGSFLLPASGLEGQSVEETIAEALAPLSGRTAEGAAVVRWNADHTWETLKEGTNTWVCYDRSADPGTRAVDSQCTVAGNLPRVAQNRRFAAEAADRNERRAMVEAAAADGTRVEAQYGSMWLTMRGNDLASASVHTTIAVPFATGESTGFPTDRASGGAYLMAAGTSEAHIMVPR